MSKRKSEALGPAPPAAPAKRCADFNMEVRALNAQFAAWVSRQQSVNPDRLWDASIKDYLKYAEKLRSDYADVLTPSGSSDPTVPSGKVFVMGQGDMGQLGLGEDITELLKPAPVIMAGGLRVIQIACGGMHTLALAEGGVVFSWGVNDEGALGREARGGHLAEQEGETEGSEVVPDRVKMPAGHQAVAVSAGDSHSVALTATGTVLAWGVFRDSSGKFGFSAASKDVQPVPAVVQLPEKVTAIASGSDHVAALSAHGAVYTWGCAECGRLGRMLEGECDPKFVKGDKTAWKARLLTPAVVPGLQRVSSVACGLYCTFAVAGGDVWAWGLNQYGQLGIQAEGPFYKPERAPSLCGIGVEKIGGGEHHTLVACKGGEALSFGRATYGRLGRRGVDVNEDERHWQPAKVEVAGRVVGVVGGLSVSAVLTEDGGLWCCGSGGEGLLGQGDDESDAVVPKRVALRGSALGASFGGQHMAVLVREEGAAGNPSSQKRQR